jgi:hypothetical protein
MKTDMNQTLQILNFTNHLIQQEEKLWQQIKDAELVFGTDSETHNLARARWNTTNEILQQILLITNNY